MDEGKHTPGPVAMSAFEDLLNSMRGARLIICHAYCPTTWPTGTGRPHSYECDVASQAIARATTAQVTETAAPEMKEALEEVERYGANYARSKVLAALRKATLPASGGAS